MKKRTLTSEQLTERNRRREAFQQLCKKIKNLEVAERNALARMVSIRNVKGHELSTTNQILIMWQGGKAATIVAGFKGWLKEKRVVMKGQHGYTIWIPTGAGKQADLKDPSDTGESTGDSPRGFILGTVFDVTQTEELKPTGETTPATEPAQIEEGQRALAAHYTPTQEIDADTLETIEAITETEEIQREAA